MNRKPEVIFDATNKEHRKAYRKFLKEKSWGHLPFVFKAPHFGITLGYIERSLLQFYSGKEFTAKET